LAGFDPRYARGAIFALIDPPSCLMPLRENKAEVELATNESPKSTPTEFTSSASVISGRRGKATTEAQRCLVTEPTFCSHVRRGVGSIAMVATR
jgi:hypothetical protein